MRRTLTGLAVAAVCLAATGVAIAQITGGVPSPNPRSGTPSDILATGYTKSTVALGAQGLENPTGVFTQYGYLNDAATQASGLKTKTEPDQNTYLVAPGNPGGPTANYDYGRRFLVQSHELFSGSGTVGQTKSAYITRVNLDVPVGDPHRITLLSTIAPNGIDTGAASLDGSSYDPFTGDLLATGEGNNAFGGVFKTQFNWAGTTAPPVTQLLGAMGTAGYEGVQLDSHGNIYLVEDAGGSTVTDGATVTKVKQPNSFLFRFKPTTPSDLTAGKLQVLQVSADGAPITFHSGGTGPRDDALGEPIRRLHSGEELDAQWVTVHDTAVDGTASFNANTLAKSVGGTPLKRPENGKFVPGSGFKSFVFTETGDTDRAAGEYPGAAARGSWGALLRLDLPTAGANSGSVKAIEVGDAAHAAFDNITFLDKETMLVGEDRGDGLHQSLNALDSLWAFDSNQPIDQINGKAQRLIAQGRDPESLDDVSKKEGTPVVADQNDGDNEVTGIHVSDGNMTIGGILGAFDPAKLSGVRTFVTYQHGANGTFELNAPAANPAPSGKDGKDGTPGAPGAPGAPGTNGSNGPAGANGANGSVGTNGANGLPGATGAPGPKGATGATGKAGKNGKTPSCKVSGKKITCSTGAKKRSTRASARLTRSGRTYARGTLGHLTKVRTVKKGKYTLVIGSGRKTQRVSVSVR